MEESLSASASFYARQTAIHCASSATIGGTTMEVRPFTIHVPDDVLDDLRRRLGQTRFPDAIPGSGWDYGSNLEYLKELVHYWRTDFDWRAQEAQLNRFHHYKTLVDGLNIRSCTSSLRINTAGSPCRLL